MRQECCKFVRFTGDGLFQKTLVKISQESKKLISVSDVSFMAFLIGMFSAKPKRISILFQLHLIEQDTDHTKLLH